MYRIITTGGIELPADFGRRKLLDDAEPKKEYPYNIYCSNHHMFSFVKGFDTYEEAIKYANENDLWDLGEETDGETYYTLFYPWGECEEL